MKIVSKEELEAHQRVTLHGVLLGGSVGLALGSAGVIGASYRWPFFRSLTLPMRAFLVTSTGTFCAIVQAERASRKFEIAHNPDQYTTNSQEEILQQARAAMSWRENAGEWLREHRYPLVFGSWVASVAVAFGLVSRNPYLTTAQKVVQARVYAQGLTVGVLLASFGLEAADASQGKGRWGWQTVKVMENGTLVEKRVHKERYEGEDRWMDMVEAEEKREKAEEEEKKKLLATKASSKA